METVGSHGSIDILDSFRRRLGFNTASLPNRSLDEALACGKQMGFATVELLAFAGYRHTAGDLAGHYFDRMPPDEMAELREMIVRFKHVAVHAPFWEIAHFSPNPVIREASRRQTEATLEVAGEIGARTVTTHVQPRPGFEFREYRDEVIDFYRHLGEVGHEAGLTVTIETGFPTEIEEFASLIHDIDHDWVGANVDVGHLRGLLTDAQRRPEAIDEAYNSLLREHLRSLEDRVYHIHLHDVHAEGLRDHRECGTGIVDYAALLALLLQQGYEGLMTFELEETDAEGALRRSHENILAAIREVARRDLSSRH